MPSTLVEGGTEVKEWLKSFWRPSDNKPDIDYLQVLVNINSHAWDGESDLVYPRETDLLCGSDATNSYSLPHVVMCTWARS